MPDSIDAEKRALVLAPTGRDGVLITEMLEKAGLPCHMCKSVEQLAAELGRGASMALLAEEALFGVPIRPFTDVLTAQPSWSDLPLLFLTTTGRQSSAASDQLLRLLGDEANITIFERPIR